MRVATRVAERRKKFNFSRSALFHMKTRVSLKYSMNGCSIKRQGCNFFGKGKNKKKRSKIQEKLQNVGKFFITMIWPHDAPWAIEIDQRHKMG